jgi:glycosyltransferase involved in cell wall biosynthesis
MLINAFEQVDTGMKLVLAGGSSHTDQYVTNLRTHESEKVRLLDCLSGDALQEVLTNAALFVLPSDMEGLSLALLDAMGAGICVLSSDTPENREVMADAGFTFRKGDVEHLRQMLTMLISDADLRFGIGKKAQRRIHQEYLWDNVIDRLEHIYLDLTGTKRARMSESAVRAVSGKAA